MVQLGMIADQSKAVIEVGPTLIRRKEGLQSAMVDILFIEIHQAVILRIPFPEMPLLELHDEGQFFRNNHGRARAGDPPAAAVSEVEGKSRHLGFRFNKPG